MCRNLGRKAILYFPTNATADDRVISSPPGAGRAARRCHRRRNRNRADADAVLRPAPVPIPAARRPAPR
jgi:hypothetical protein